MVKSLRQEGQSSWQRALCPDLWTNNGIDFLQMRGKKPTYLIDEVYNLPAVEHPSVNVSIFTVAFLYTTWYYSIILPLVTWFQIINIVSSERSSLNKPGLVFGGSQLSFSNRTQRRPRVCFPLQDIQIRFHAAAVSFSSLWFAWRYLSGTDTDVHSCLLVECPPNSTCLEGMSSYESKGITHTSLQPFFNFKCKLLRLDYFQ